MWLPLSHEHRLTMVQRKGGEKNQNNANCTFAWEWRGSLKGAPFGVSFSLCRLARKRSL